MLTHFGTVKYFEKRITVAKTFANIIAYFKYLDRLEIFVVMAVSVLFLTKALSHSWEMGRTVPHLKSEECSILG